ncbi:DNA excision repair protein ERCC-6-like 2 isoform X2 [Oryzias latipes]|uniref:DNA excision repair protein ERCC-6-like 2 isoform X2 n=1 Tax=Oryzias latipes TaxID=8090 RepID=UPI0005CC4351|nr:DNA excision repair protein ERCC-6-like 2 isoform X2 [Oryzias latipes]
MALTSAAKEASHEVDCCLAPASRDALTKDAEDDRGSIMRPEFSHLSQEKPVFPGGVTDSSFFVHLNLSDEDRVPFTINRYLRDYQREGIKFIYKNYIRSSGCILGDDMGLGKTVQVIGFLAAVLHKTGTWEDVENNRPLFLQSQIPSKESNSNKVFLVVAPLSVLYNWKDELDTWGYFHCVVVHGLRKEEELTRISNGRIEIALTTYETLRLCLDQFNMINWSAVFVDEAHKIKNPNSQITQAMKGLRCKVRIGLTGTILQNNLEELWCVMDWAVPGCLGNLGHFKNKFSDPVEQGQRHSATKRALATGRKTVRALVKKISPWFLRRTKALIEEQLPKKDDRVVYCSLTDFQQAVYQAVLDTEDVTLLLRSSDKCECQSGRTRRSCCYKKNSEGAQIKELYFSYLAILRKVANHAALLQFTPGTSKKQRCRNEAFEALSDPTYSGKMKVLQKLLKYYLQKRSKMLIFSLSTKLLDVLESYCMAEGLDYSRLDGTTKSKDRVQIVKDFNSSSHVNLCLVSTMAGGLGLNFVGANVVVLFDPTWNPANDLQAIDRAYRIGQCRDVTVLRLISLGTVEEIIYLRQVYKQQLQCSVVGEQSARRYFEAVQGHGVYKGELFGIKNLFRLQTQGTCLTRRILEREGLVEAGVMTAKTHSGDEKEKEGNGEPGDALTGAAGSNNEAAKGKEALEASRDVLDFSSGSETEEEKQVLKGKASNLSCDSNLGKASTASGRMNLLQHGFSRLLEGAKENPDKSSSSETEDTSSEEDAEDQKMRNVPESRLKNWSTERKFEDCRDEIFQEKEETVRMREKRVEVVEESGINSSPEREQADKNRELLPKSHHFQGYSDESDDLDLEAKTRPKKEAYSSNNTGAEIGRGKHDHNKRRRSTSVRDKARSKYTADIETFTSSEDEAIPTTDPTARGASRPKAVSFTSLRNQTSPASKERNRTIDCVLGGVQEVVFSHSNQRVVGGSRAEELISRAAVRDVFERKMYSQLPANNLVGTQESLPMSLPERPPCPANVTEQRPNADHPVLFSSKSTHCKGHATVVIGETPKAIQRLQLMEMAQKFTFASVHQFAEEILKRSSADRLAWLRQYYTSFNHPELANIITENFSSTSSATSSSIPKDPQKDSLRDRKRLKNDGAKPQSLQNTVSVPQNRSDVQKDDGLEPPRKQKKGQKKALQTLANISSPDLTDQEVCPARGPKRTKRANVSSSGAHRAGGGPGMDQAIISGLGSVAAAAVLNRTDRNSPSSSDLSSAVASNPAALKGELEHKPTRTSSKFSFLTDLVGDTSILDELLKPKPKVEQQLTKTPSGGREAGDPDSSPCTAEQVHRPPRAPKGARRDIWDILDEGNEESINRLTDPEEVQRVCIDTNLAARRKSGQNESKSLWKTNEKFLWKKGDL